MSAMLHAATYASTAPFKLMPSIAKCVRVYDGDTVWLAFEHGDCIVRNSARLVGVDTPEVRTRDAVEKKAGLAARDELRARIMDKIVRVRVHENATDKYGRMLVWLWDNEGDYEYDRGLSINTQIERRWGVPYTGGTKVEQDWSRVPRDGTLAL